MIPPNKRTSQISIQRPFHISQAVLDMSQTASGSNQLWVHCNGKMALIANLDNTITHVRLDLAFGIGDIVQFYNKSFADDSNVHLSGYYLDDDGEQEEKASKQNLSLKESRHDSLDLSNHPDFDGTTYTVNDSHFRFKILLS